MGSSRTTKRTKATTSQHYYSFFMSTLFTLLSLSLLIQCHFTLGFVIPTVVSSTSSSSSSSSTPSLSTSNQHYKSTNNMDKLPSKKELHILFKRRSRSGGRAPGEADKVLSSDDNNAPWEAKPCAPSECRLTVIQITDVYTLENLASVKTLIEETKKKAQGSKVISMLTGDFLSPYLLSSVDRGQGMMNALAKIPIDYLTWGNHEADIKHKTVCRHVREFPGKWINSNMLDHEAMDAQQEYEILEVTSPDGSQTRKVGLVAVLSDAPGLYAHFKPPGAFGGATIDDPWKTLQKYKTLLMGPEFNCDMILPLQHTYVPDDHKTCREFDFPVILSGHDHHRVDEVVEGTRLLKPGMDAKYATVLELTWDSASAIGNKPKVQARFVKCDEWTPEPELAEECDRAYDCLLPLRNTELARIPPTFEPLSSVDSRAKVTTMGKYICSLLKSSLNVRRRQRQHKVDAVLLMGGNIRGGTDYPDGGFFSLEALEAEIKEDEVVAVLPMPGWLLAEGVTATHAGDPIPGWMQYDIGVKEDFSTNPPTITHVNNEPIDPNRIYRVATKIGDLTNGQSPPWTEYYQAHPELKPPKGAYVNIHAELMAYIAKNLWRKIWDAISSKIANECEIDTPEHVAKNHRDCHPELRLDALDYDNDGIVSVQEIQEALKDLVGLSVDDRELSLAEFVHSFADHNGTGQVTLEDFELFCDEIDDVYDQDSWRLSHARPIVQAIVSDPPKDSTPVV